MKQFTALLFDLDGTLIGADERTCKASMQAIRKVAEFRPVAIVSGRYRKFVAKMAQELGLTNPQVAENGATLVDPLTGQVVESHCMQDNIAAELVKIVAKHPYRFWLCDTDSKNINGLQSEPRSATALTVESVDGIRSKRLISSLKKEIGEETDELEFNVSRGVRGEWYVVVCAKGVDKGFGVTMLANRLNLDLTKTVAIGDGPNDLPMFKRVGYSVAMGESVPELVKIANEQTSGCNQQGLARALSRLFNLRLAVPSS